MSWWFIAHSEIAESSHLIKSGNPRLIGFSRQQQQPPLVQNRAFSSKEKADESQSQSVSLSSSPFFFLYELWLPFESSTFLISIITSGGKTCGEKT